MAKNKGAGMQALFQSLVPNPPGTASIRHSWGGGLQGPQEFMRGDKGKDVPIYPRT